MMSILGAGDKIQRGGAVAIAIVSERASDDVIVKVSESKRGVSDVSHHELITRSSMHSLAD